MKKLFYVFIVALTALVSCSHENDSTINEISEECSFNELMNEIETYNAEFGIGTKANGGFWRRLGRVAAADGIGFAVGSVGGPGVGLLSGVLSSFFAACRELMTATFTKAASNVIELSDDKLYSNASQASLSECDYLGEIHNLILEEIYEENPDCFSTFTESQIIAAIQQKIANYYPNENIPSSAVDIDDTKNLVNVILNPDLTITQVFDNVRLKLPSKVNEINVIEQYCATVSAIDDNEVVIQYTDGFRTVVDESDIADDSKDNIKSTVSVVGNSRLLWSECAFEE
ncbi:MAG: hypothetical protein ACI3ZL_09975 [Candidatus Cryptobacteroides sp.]